MDQSSWAGAADSVVSSVQDAIERLQQQPHRVGPGRDPLDFPRGDLQNLRKALLSGDADSAAHAAFMLGLFYATIPSVEATLSTKDLIVLRFLADKPSMAFTAVDIGSGDVSRKTAGEILKRLESLGMVRYPRGPRMGAQITPAGESALRAAFSAH